MKNWNCSWKLQKNELNLHPSTRQGRPPGRRRSWPELFLRRVIPSDNYVPRRPLHFQMLDSGEWIWLHLDPSFLKMKVRVFQWSMENYRSGIQKRSLLWSTSLFLLPTSFANRNGSSVQPRTPWIRVFWVEEKTKAIGLMSPVNIGFSPHSIHPP